MVAAASGRSVVSPLDSTWPATVGQSSQPLSEQSGHGREGGGFLSLPYWCSRGDPTGTKEPKGAQSAGVTRWNHRAPSPQATALANHPGRVTPLINQSLMVEPRSENPTKVRSSPKSSRVVESSRVLPNKKDAGHVVRVRDSCAHHLDSHCVLACEGSWPQRPQLLCVFPSQPLVFPTGIDHGLRREGPTSPRCHLGPSCALESSKQQRTMPTGTHNELGTDTS
jgi:hypothetical protein